MHQDIQLEIISHKIRHHRTKHSHNQIKKTQMNFLKLNRQIKSKIQESNKN